jgi:hypothetical protein
MCRWIIPHGLQSVISAEDDDSLVVLNAGPGTVSGVTFHELDRLRFVKLKQNSLPHTSKVQPPNHCLLTTSYFLPSTSYF